MLFNSYEFLFHFLPWVALGFFAIGRVSQSAAAGWLGAASLFFYGWWSPASLPLLVGSIVANYGFGLALARPAAAHRQRWLLSIAVAANLGLLGFFKYADFFLSNVNAALALGGAQRVALLDIALPIGISFYTFTQIAFLVDCHRQRVRETSFVHYLLFVSYFPHLIAGPVLHHAQMMPQFTDRRTYRPSLRHIATGITLFAIGLAKKLFIADPNGVHADQFFDHPGAPGFVAASAGTLAYALQIYFDFSGYSDMALGLSRLFSIRLPINFDSPYRATSVIDFWRRWHISLSTFLRDYLYVPLGGNRHGASRRHLNLFVTMLLGGLWHGASWTFVGWGALHGAYLLVNHAWRQSRWAPRFRGRLGTGLGWALTFVAVSLAWVLFRATSLGDAASIYRGLAGANGWQPQPVSGEAWQWIALGAAVALLPFNSMHIAGIVERGFGTWRPAFVAAAGAAGGTLLALALLKISSTAKPQFIYFQF